MIPIIALIGRQNVGKSTLFNRLTNSRDALVANFPGLTRDRKYGHVEVSGRKFICVDTAGIYETKGGVEMCTEEQSILAIEEANIVLFIVDARAGIMFADYAIARYLCLYEKLTFLVVNKIDGINTYQAIADFWSLGFSKMYPISASHGYGITNLLEALLLSFVDTVKQLKVVDGKNIHRSKHKGIKKNKDELPNSNFAPHDLPIKLAIVGRPNVGKSTLINRILDEDRMVVYDTPGTTRDSIYIPMDHKNRKYMLIDTAGVRKRSKIIDIVEKFSVIKTLQSIEDANVVLLMINALEGISNQDLSLLDFILNCGRSLVIVVNKWDSLCNKERELFKKNLDYRLNFIDYASTHFISAFHGNGVDNLLESASETYDSSTRRHSTASLTRIMNMAVENYQPPLVRGRRVKMKYAHAGGYNPPTIVIHGNQVKDLSNSSYKRYLVNYFRKSLEVIGTSIRIQFREGDNPFVNKNNITNSNKIHKRITNHIKKTK